MFGRATIMLGIGPHSSRVLFCCLESNAYEGYWNSGKSTKTLFTKRIPGLKDLSYCQKLTRLKLDSFELRRVRLDLTFAYELVFNWPKAIWLFSTAQRCQKSETGQYNHTNVFCQVQLQSTTTLLIGLQARIWNNLQEDSINFSSLSIFKRSLSSNILAISIVKSAISRLGYINIWLYRRSNI